LTRIYARAAAWIVGADRWADEKWRDLEDQVGPQPDDVTQAQHGDTAVPAGVLARVPVEGGKRRSDWLTVDKGWLK
jgi:hypothetical protein